jgi:hypothetical protein
MNIIVDLIIILTLKAKLTMHNGVIKADLTELKNSVRDQNTTFKLKDVEKL